MHNKFIFDFGQVLVHFNPEIIVRPYISDKDDSNLVQRVLFDRLYWDRLDAGTIEDEEVIRLSCGRLPERLHNSVREIYENWYYNIPEVDGMRELLSDIKKGGGKLYLLSNISKGFAEHSHEIEILKPFDGMVFSATCGYTKPSIEIFNYICKKYDLEPNETLYIDDNKKNIEGGQSIGLKTYLFDGNTSELRAAIEEFSERN